MADRATISAAAIQRYNSTAGLNTHVTNAASGDGAPATIANLRVNGITATNYNGLFRLAGDTVTRAVMSNIIDTLPKLGAHTIATDGDGLPALAVTNAIVGPSLTSGTPPRRRFRLAMALLLRKDNR